MQRETTARLPSISVLVPVLNAQRTIGECLAAIRRQRYSQERIEIVVADGGSKDDTLRIASNYDVRVVMNPLRTGETGKAVALACARNELVCLIDSDNVLVGDDWLARMVAPFQNVAVVGSEPIAFASETHDTLVDRYCAAMGVNDPICLFLGNYDRRSALTGRWTSLPIETEDVNGDLYFRLGQPWLPTIGANGTMYRRIAIASLVSDELVDIDLPYQLKALDPAALFVKVNVSVRHLYCRDVQTFVRKQRRRVRDYFAVRSHGRRAYPWTSEGWLGSLKFCLFTLFVMPLFWQASVAFVRSRQKAVFFHPVACFLTLATYSMNYVFARGRPLSRDGWRQ
ncbi:MAG: glycosyltransferase family 2 protein [Vulcanimicrobiaceae bacterium]